MFLRLGLILRVSLPRVFTIRLDIQGLTTSCFYDSVGYSGAHYLVFLRVDWIVRVSIPRVFTIGLLLEGLTSSCFYAWNC